MQEARFGPFRIDLPGRRLTCGGAPVPLGSRAMDILLALVSARGELVSKDALMATVWPDAIVEDNTLQVHVSALRKALAGADAGSEAGWIVTVPGRGYRLPGVREEGPPIEPRSHALPDKPSIAVLPFANIGGDAQQEYFADGITEDIITALCRFRWFFVIGRNSSFAYKGRSVDAKRIGAELGVRYILEGSVRRSADRVRITALLVDAATGTQLWAEHYDRELSAMFAVQDEITDRVAGAIEPELRMAEGDRAAPQLRGTLTVWDLIRQGTWNFHQLTEPTHRRARELFREAVRLAPDSSEAQMWLSRAATGLAAYGWCEDPGAMLRESLDAALQAVRRDPRDAYSHFALAMAQVFTGDFEQAARSAETAATASPSFALGHLGLGMALLYGGRAEEAIEPLNRGLRLNPFDPQNSHWYRLLALALLFANRRPAALEAAHRALQARPGWRLTLETAAICHAALDQLPEACVCLNRMRALPSPKGDPTSIMRLRNPAWAAEIEAQLRRCEQATLAGAP